MARFFHISVDDIGYHAGYTLQLAHLKSSDSLRAGEVAQMKALFPDGLSIWGFKIVNPGSWIEGEPTPEQQIMLEREADFEEVRRLHFPDKPSRLQSLFGFATLDDVTRLRRIRSLHDARVWQVEAGEVFVGDMSLYEGYTIGHFKEVATRYWAGEKTPEPFFDAVMKLPVQVIEQVCQTIQE